MCSNARVSGCDANRRWGTRTSAPLVDTARAHGGAAVEEALGLADGVALEEEFGLAPGAAVAEALGLADGAALEEESGDA